MLTYDNRILFSIHRAAKVASFVPFVRAITLNGFDQPDGADGNEVLHVFAGVVEIFEVVNTMRCQKINQLRSIPIRIGLFLCFIFNL